MGADPCCGSTVGKYRREPNPQASELRGSYSMEKKFVSTSPSYHGVSPPKPGGIHHQKYLLPASHVPYAQHTSPASRPRCPTAQHFLETGYTCFVCKPQLVLSLWWKKTKNNQLCKAKKCPELSIFPKVNRKEHRPGRRHNVPHKILWQLTAKKTSSSFFLLPLCFYYQTPKQSTKPQPRQNINLGVTKQNP